MKLHVLSDLHLELCGFDPDAAAVRQAHVIILAGDIDKGIKGMGIRIGTQLNAPGGFKELHSEVTYYFLWSDSERERVHLTRQSLGVLR